MGRATAIPRPQCQTVAFCPCVLTNRQLTHAYRPPTGAIEVPGWLPALSVPPLRGCGCMLPHRTCSACFSLSPVCGGVWNRSRSKMAVAQPLNAEPSHLLRVGARCISQRSCTLSNLAYGRLTGGMTIFPLNLDFLTKSPLSAFCASGASGRRGM